MSDPGRDLELGPALAYRAKGLLVHARSLAWRTRPRREPAAGVRILLYHRVTDEPDRLAVTPRRFREQLRLLATSGVRIVDAGEAAAAAARGEDGVVGLSFDDGYRDVVEHAGPALAEYGARATVFVCPEVVAGRARFTWYREQPPLLGWEEIRGLDGGSPFRFEAHTLTHPNLLALSDDEAWREIEGSRSAVAEALGRPAEGFCYPAGLYGPRERDLVARAGFTYAVTCEPGSNGPGTDPFALRRTAIESHDRRLDVAAKIAGAHDRPLPLRGLYRRLRYGREAAAASSA